MIKEQQNSCPDKRNKPHLIFFGQGLELFLHYEVCVNCLKALILNEQVFANGSY